jgi:serine/threonine protein kinase
MISIPNIDLGQEIGKGGFGKVYRARHRTFDVDVAVKLIPPSDVGPAVEDALKEARLMARLDHPNLLRIFDAGRADNGILYLVLELMDTNCKGLHRVPPGHALDLATQLLAGVQALHDARVLHRDIKPANCLVRARDQRVKLADLGIALEHSTRSYQVADASGTLPFMAPEVFDTPPRFSVASDLYALGITLQCLVLDADPFPLVQHQLLRWLAERPPANVAERRPDLPPRLTSVIEHLSATTAKDRPPSAAAALAELSGDTPSREDAADAGDRTTRQVVGAWVFGPEIHSDGNFSRFAVTHVHTGAPGRFTTLRPDRPLTNVSPLILASAQRAAKLSHPGVVDVIDWGMHHERAYVVTRPQGQSLKALVTASGAVGELEAVQLTRGLADALAYLHGEGLVYQILTPSSAVLSPDARSAQLAWPLFCVPIGSTADAAIDHPLSISVPRFAAPESLVRPGRGSDEPPAPIQPAIDLYGLGETLYYLIAGKPAFSSTPYMTTLLLEKMRGPADLRAAAPAVTAPTAQLVAELTAPYAHQRPSNAAAVRAELDRIAGRLRGDGRGHRDTEDTEKSGR